MWKTVWLTIFARGEITSAKGKGTVLVSKKGKMTVKFKQQAPIITQKTLEHNRKKQYLLPGRHTCPVFSGPGCYDKRGTDRSQPLRQVPSDQPFLEFIEDILPQLDKHKENIIIDFGCGKSYLTFAMYYYLKELKDIRYASLDLT